MCEALGAAATAHDAPGNTSHCCCVEAEKTLNSKDKNIYKYKIHDLQIHILFLFVHPPLYWSQGQDEGPIARTCLPRATLHQAGEGATGQIFCK